jgi:geranylgeranyl reductase family protein
MRYDLIIVGAGPAGSVAAEAAARAGLRVALLEKHVLPRHKTCGGGMPMVVGKMLPDLVPEAVVEAEVRYMRHTWKFGDPVLAPINPPGADCELSLWMVQRALFDNALAQRAARAGAQLRDGLSVRTIQWDRGGVTVRASAGGNDHAFVATARHVIGADGANGITAKAADLRQNRTLAIAMEVEHPHTWGEGHPDLRLDVAHLEYGAVSYGYAWVFPKGEHLNVGAGVFRPRPPGCRGDPHAREELQKAICNYLKMLGVPYEVEAMQFHAHPLPLWNGKERLHTRDGRILLCGDAAGLINPFFGDGILHAIKSGLVAVECLVQEAPQEYTRRIHAEFAANFDAALRLARLFYAWAGFIYHHGVRRPNATRTAARLLCGEALFTDVAGGYIRRIRRAMLRGLHPDPQEG